jgi:hypothetical protein
MGDAVDSFPRRTAPGQSSPHRLARIPASGSTAPGRSVLAISPRKRSGLRCGYPIVTAYRSVPQEPASKVLGTVADRVFLDAVRRPGSPPSGSPRCPCGVRHAERPRLGSRLSLDAASKDLRAILEGEAGRNYRVFDGRNLRKVTSGPFSNRAAREVGSRNDSCSTLCS